VNLLRPLACALTISSLAVCLLPASRTYACTVFVLTGGERVLFCNNEDFTNPRTRIWFIPANKGRYGCEFVGFDDGWGQGGLNEKGLAYAWVAGYQERWERLAEHQDARGNPCQRMLESCDSVEEAVAFFEHRWEESFAYGRLLVADRTGNSAILRAKKGKLHAPIRDRSQGIGHRFDLRGTEVAEAVAQLSKPTMPDAVRFMRATLQEGSNATKYSVVYDLESGDIDLYRFPKQSKPVQFNLARELTKGPHYYDIPALPEQLQEPLRPLTDEMKKY
jgi:predicted choloylglycine hydrolase